MFVKKKAYSFSKIIALNLMRIGNLLHGDSIIPPDLSAELLHLQSQEVISARKGLIREEEVGG